MSAARSLPYKDPPIQNSGCNDADGLELFLTIAACCAQEIDIYIYRNVTNNFLNLTLALLLQGRSSRPGQTSLADRAAWR